MALPPSHHTSRLTICIVDYVALPYKGHPPLHTSRHKRQSKNLNDSFSYLYLPPFSSPPPPSTMSQVNWISSYRYLVRISSLLNTCVNNYSFNLNAYFLVCFRVCMYYNISLNLQLSSSNSKVWWVCICTIIGVFQLYRRDF